MDTGIPLDSETHAGEEVAIFARGPMAHLFHKVHEQSYMAHVMAYSMCIGPNQDACEPEAGAANVYTANVYVVLLTSFVAAVLTAMLK